MEIHDIAKLYAMLPQVGALRHVLENKSEKDVFLEGLVGSSQPLLFAALSQKEKKKPLPSSFLFVLPDADEAGYFYSDLMQLENLPKEGGESAGAAAQVLFFPSSYRRAVKYGQRDAANEILRTEVLARLNTSLSTLHSPLDPQGRFRSEAEKELSARPEGTLSERSGERTLNSPLSTPPPSVLIVEDDADLLSFLASHFAQDYTVLTAVNGIEALQQLSQNAVSLIISDWMMPEMDGAEFCRRLRANRDTSHIPLIMLTAKTDDDSKAESMQMGADAFIEKPFSMKYLDACLSNLIERRRELMRRFSQQPAEPIEPLANNDLDNELLTKMNHIIVENMTNPALSVNFLAEQLNISRSGLFSKIKALTDVTPNEMIQVVRLRRAAQLLAEGQHRVNEVCYMVGFSSPSYFSKCFQKQFGKKPGEMMKS